MSEKTFKRRVAQLVEQLENHPHKDEILAIALDKELEFMNMDMDEYDISPFHRSLLINPLP